MYCLLDSAYVSFIDPIPDGWDWEGQKGFPYQFFPVTFPNIGTSHQNVVAFSLTLLLHCCKTLGSYLMPVPNY